MGKVNKNQFIGIQGGARLGDMKQEISCQSLLVLTWSEKAAAEAVAAASCSGHGRAFVDHLTSDGQPVYECFNCYNGSDCSLYSRECDAVATRWSELNKTQIL
ncbi:putative alliinase, EGF-like domain, alliinase domain superfamily [Helianthus annuus]|nr:putative alliinase, EGF-like domain, alliinase domain superfamily [Helianthus annuus]